MRLSAATSDILTAPAERARPQTCPSNRVPRLVNVINFGAFKPPMCGSSNMGVVLARHAPMFIADCAESLTVLGNCSRILCLTLLSFQPAGVDRICFFKDTEHSAGALSRYCAST